MDQLSKIDAIVHADRYMPRWGFHDDHREADGTPRYLPAIQQVRSEFFLLINVLERAGVLNGRCLQLGIGEIEASHHLWNAMFGRGAVTIDRSVCMVGEHRHAGAETANELAHAIARASAPYDFLFIDAGHSLEEVICDHEDYAPMVASGGIIAFHDALKRPGYDEVEVWLHMEQLECSGVRVNLIGTEVGVAWIEKK